MSTCGRWSERWALPVALPRELQLVQHEDPAGALEEAGEGRASVPAAAWAAPREPGGGSCASGQFPWQLGCSRIVFFDSDRNGVEVPLLLTKCWVRLWLRLRLRLWRMLSRPCLLLHHRKPRRRNRRLLLHGGHLNVSHGYLVGSLDVLLRLAR